MGIQLFRKYFSCKLMWIPHGLRFWDSRRTFNKPHLTVDQQIDLLISRGMDIPNRGQAVEWLEHINYYRLGYYWHNFEADHTTHKFKSGTSFDKIVRRYKFDRELRSHILIGIETIEVSFRTQWTYFLSKDHGPYGHLNKSIHDRNWKANRKDIVGEINRSKVQSIKQFSRKYTQLTPPIWAVSEVMSFGSISKWYASLNDQKTKEKIVQRYNLSTKEVTSWMSHLAVIRNACAHHRRVWDVNFTSAPPRKKKSKLTRYFVDNHPVYNALLIILYLLEKIDRKSHSNWKKQLITLIEKHQVPVTQMGFPRGWRKLHIWQ